MTSIAAPSCAVRCLSAVAVLGVVGCDRHGPVIQTARVTEAHELHQPLPSASSSASEARPATDAAPVVELNSEPAVTQASQQTARESIYDTSTPGRELIAAALKRAELGQKHVLIEWGGNWCSWCLKLHDLFAHDPLVHPLVSNEFELVLVDSKTNHDLLREYGGKDRQYSFPHLTVLDATGAVLTNQNTEPLEQGKGHSPEAVAKFLREWMPAKSRPGESGSRN